MPHNIIFLIALLIIMAVVVIGSFVFVILVDRLPKREDRGQEQRDATNSEEGT